MMLRKDRSKRSACLFYRVLLGLSLHVAPLWACEGVITEPLEKLYCDVKAKGGGQSLPRFDDFRRNNPQMQRLLLKRPAAKAGLVLPNVGVLSSKQPNVNRSDIKRNAKSLATKKPMQQSSRNKLGRLPNDTRANGLALSEPLSGCRIVSRAIHCGERRYVLRDNQANQNLAPNALTAANELILPRVPAYRGSQALHQYLHQAYAVYLNKMDAIGLAGATFTYSKFYYIFEDAQAQKQDFVQRFKSMYHYLKKDKATMAAARRHKSNMLSSLDTCERYGTRYIGCDVRGVNWLFRADR